MFYPRNILTLVFFCKTLSEFYILKNLQLLILLDLLNYFSWSVTGESQIVDEVRVKR